MQVMSIVREPARLPVNTWTRWFSRVSDIEPSNRRHSSVGKRCEFALPGRLTPDATAFRRRLLWTLNCRTVET